MSRSSLFLLTSCFIGLTACAESLSGPADRVESP